MGQKTIHGYELELRRMIKARTGKECEVWLRPQIHTTALNMELIEKVHTELMEGKIVFKTSGSMGQAKSEVSPLLPYYDKLNRTLLAQLEALGLNYNTTPRKVTENTKQGGSEQDKLARLLQGLQAST